MPPSKPNVVSTSSSEAALGHFKDWSNYLLVTTVAALGWVAHKEALDSSPVFKNICIVSFALSIISGIFTLALIPLIAEQRGATKSFYEVEAKFNLFSRPFRGPTRIKTYCFPQHVFFIIGIVSFAIGAIWR